MYAGELLKLIDIVAGVTSRRHAELGCVTISLDRFILVKLKSLQYSTCGPTNPVLSNHQIQEVRAGDLLHFYASVNRAWGTSMGMTSQFFWSLLCLDFTLRTYLETGVKVTRESPTSGRQQYCCHGRRHFPLYTEVLPDAVITLQRISHSWH